MENKILHTPITLIIEHINQGKIMGAETMSLDNVLQILQHYKEREKFLIMNAFVDGRYAEVDYNKYNIDKSSDDYYSENYI